MATGTLTLGAVQGSKSLSFTISSTGSLVTLLDAETVADGQTDQLITFTLDVSACTMFCMVSTKNVTVQTNNGTTPDNTLTLRANEPYLWHTNSYDTFKLTVDVTKIYVTNASGASATIDAIMITDATP